MAIVMVRSRTNPGVVWAIRNLLSSVAADDYVRRFRNQPGAEKFNAWVINDQCPTPEEMLAQLEELAERLEAQKNQVA
jgi:hypothetical protein